MLKAESSYVLTNFFLQISLKTMSSREKGPNELSVELHVENVLIINKKKSDTKFSHLIHSICTFS